MTDDERKEARKHRERYEDKMAGYQHSVTYLAAQREPCFRPFWQGCYVLPYFDGDGRPVYATSRSTGSEGGYDGHLADRRATPASRPSPPDSNTTTASVSKKFSTRL